MSDLEIIPRKQSKKGVPEKKKNGDIREKQQSYYKGLGCTCTNTKYKNEILKKSEIKAMTPIKPDTSYDNQSNRMKYHKPLCKQWRKICLIENTKNMKDIRINFTNNDEMTHLPHTFHTLVQSTFLFFFSFFFRGGDTKNFPCH